MSGRGRMVVGLGNRFRGDDRAGLEVAERIRGRLPAGAEALAIEGDPTALIDIFASAELVLVADAVTTDEPSGAVYRFDASDDPIPGAVFGSSTHAFGVGETIELARALGQLCARVLVYGIPGEDFSAGEHLSPAVETQIQTAIEQMLADLSLPGRPPISATEGETQHA